MNRLQTYLDQLCSLAQNWAKQPLSWSSILIVEDSTITHGEISLIRRSVLATPEEYAARFEMHLNKGYSWINMNAAGIVDGIFLVVIELPKDSNPHWKNKTSINFSGPNRGQWDANNRIKFMN